MDKTARGEPVGCLALLLALAALAFAASASAPVQRWLHPTAPGLASSLSGDPTRGPLAPEVEALREETRRAREERMSARKERMLSVAERYEEGGHRQYHRIVLRNTCRFAVAVALHYRDIDDSPVTRGWWEVPPGGSVTTDAMTRDAVFHVYAENQAVGRTWDGAGRDGALSLLVSDEKFDHLEGEPPLFRASRDVSFARREAGPEWADSLETFECPVEAAPPRGTVAEPPSSGQGPRSH